MTATIHEVLGELRATSLDERDKGDKFERLVLAYLRTDPEWTAKFSEVWLWTEWPGRAGVTDVGIDLVASNRDRDDFTAIQCKFYGPGHRVAKADIDSFLSASTRPDFRFSQRIVFDTSAGWSGNGEETLKGVAQRVDISYLDDAAIDWSQYRWETPEVVVSTSVDAHYRASSQGRLTALPEDPILLRIYPVEQSAEAERDFHAWLRDADHAASRTRRGGSEWFVTSTKFLDRIARSRGLSVQVVTEFEAGDD